MAAWVGGGSLADKTIWTEVKVQGVAYRVAQIKSTSFELGGRVYPIGSWLVRGPGDPYARALSEREYAEFIR